MSLIPEVNKDAADTKNQKKRSILGDQSLFRLMNFEEADQKSCWSFITDGDTAQKDEKTLKNLCTNTFPTPLLFCKCDIG